MTAASRISWNATNLMSKTAALEISDGKLPFQSNDSTKGVPEKYYVKNMSQIVVTSYYLDLASRPLRRAYILTLHLVFH